MLLRERKLPTPRAVGVGILAGQGVRQLDATLAGRHFDCILYCDMSRFWRGGTNETGYYLRGLKPAGVDVSFPADSEQAFR